jgi:hypothetical protein
MNFLLFYEIFVILILNGAPAALVRACIAFLYAEIDVEPVGTNSALIDQRATPPRRVEFVSVKFSNLAMVVGVVSFGDLLVSVAAVAARWVDRLQLVEVDLCDGLQLLSQP